MNKLVVKLCRVVLLILILVGVVQAKPLVHVIKVEGVINPVSAQYIVKAIAEAEKQKVECLIIELDTPGGLMISMQTIVKEMLASEVPIVVYVYPSGSGAVSAGVFITMAAHIAAMAPGTNIGAAHPVTLGGRDSSKVMNEKVTNWAATYMKSIAEKRGRNAKWAEQSVRKSVSITEKEALKLKVVDLVAENLDSLLKALDGKEVAINSGKKVLHTAEATVIEREMSWRYKILDKISDPNIAYILLILGIYGLIFELSNPGSILPGVVGVIFLILAFFALQTLPINWAGLLLILFALVLFILEIKITSYGLLTVGGIISMILGSLMLIESPEAPFLRVSWSVIIPAVVVTVFFFLFAVGMGIRAQRRKATTGREGLVGEKGVALTKINGEGKVKLHGEIWQAESDEPIKKGERVQVIKVDGLQVKVVRVHN